MSIPFDNLYKTLFTLGLLFLATFGYVKFVELPKYDTEVVAVLETQAWFQGQTASMANAAPRFMRAPDPNPDGSDPLQGVDPSKGDLDDPTPPVLIVTQSPIIPGVTVPQ